MDDHKGCYPYCCRYGWVMGILMDGSGSGGGFKLKDNQIQN